MVANCTAQPSLGDLKKLDSILREDIRIYTGDFRMSLVEALHIEVYDPSLELRRNELGVRFLYKLRSNTPFTESLDDREDQNYKENKGETRPSKSTLKKPGTNINERDEREVEKTT